MLSFPELEKQPLLKSSNDPLRGLGRGRIFRKTILNGIGLYCQGYVMFVISFGLLATAETKHHAYAARVLAFIGHLATIISPVLFGYWGDRGGRKIPFTTSLTLIVIGTILSVLSLDTSSSSFLFGLFAIAQILIGIGIGGEYPLAASITSETFSIQRRGKIMVCVFAFSVVGQILGSVGSYLSIKPPGSDFRTSWRWVLAAGIIPGIAAAFLRSRRGETRRWIVHAEGATGSNWYPYLGKKLLGVIIPAFVLGILHAAHTLLLVFLLDNVFKDDPKGEMDMDKDLGTYFLAEIGLALAALPGYLASYFMVDSSRFGRKGSQVFCFLMLSVIYLLSGLGLNFIVNIDELFLAFILLSLFLIGAGPAVNIFLIPAESFPTAIRSRALGFVTMARHAGRLVASGGLVHLLSTTALEDSSVMLFICSAACLAGGLATLYFITETREHSLDNLEIRVAKLVDPSNSLESYGPYDFPKINTPPVSPIIDRASSFVNDTNQEYLDDSEDEDM